VGGFRPLPPPDPEVLFLLTQKKNSAISSQRMGINILGTLDRPVLDATGEIH